MASKKLTPHEQMVRRKKIEQKKMSSGKRKTIKTIKICAFSLIGALVIAGLSYLGVVIVQNTGAALRSTVGLKSENFKVDNAMLSYYFYTKYYDLTEDYPDYYAEKGLDKSISLKKQQYTSDKTWFTYFMNLTVEDAKEQLVFAEAAKSNGLTLNDDDNKLVDDYISALEASAEANGMSLSDYIVSLYGKGIKADDVRRAVELRLLASKQYENVMNTLNYTEDEVYSFYLGYKTYFQYSDYVSYTFKVDAEMEDETKANLQTEAQSLSNSANLDEFLSKLTDYLSRSESEEDVTQLVESAVHLKSSYETETKVGKWLFSGLRIDGDSTVIKETDGSFTAVYIIKSIYKNESSSKNIRIIPFPLSSYASDEEAKAAADAAFAEFNGGSEDDFIAIVSDISASGVSAAISDGGLVSNFLNDGSSVAEWCFDATRTSGDAQVIKTSTGYSLVYYIGEGYSGWMVEAEAYLRSKNYKTVYDGYTERFTVDATASKYNGIASLSEYGLSLERTDAPA